LTLSWVIMLKIDWFSFSNQITRVLVVQVYLIEVQSETFFTKCFVQFCILTSARYSTSCYLFLKKYLIIFGGLGYIVFIYKKFCCAQLQVFHTFEKNILVTVKNWWSLTYGQVYIYICL
jgi:hypothetical protein